MRNFHSYHIMFSKIFKVILYIPEISFPIIVWIIFALSMLTPIATGGVIPLPVGFWVFALFSYPPHEFFEYLRNYFSIPDVNDPSFREYYTVVFYAFIGFAYRIIRWFIGLAVNQQNVRSTNQTYH